MPIAVKIKSGEVKDILDAYSETARKFAEDTPELVAQYGDKWIAAYAGKICASGRSIEKIGRCLAANNIPTDRVYFRFVEKSPRTLIL